jgi:sucrose synthase
VYGRSEEPVAVGVLEELSRPLLFTMARLDRVKNLTGLVEWYVGIVFPSAAIHGSAQCSTIAHSCTCTGWSAHLHLHPCRYGRSDRLRAAVNLLVVGGVIDPADTGDREEREECEKMHRLLQRYNLKV